MKTEDDMIGQLTAHSHIEITETLVRLYVFLAQDLDRCLNEAARRPIRSRNFSRIWRLHGPR